MQSNKIYIHILFFHTIFRITNLSLHFYECLGLNFIQEQHGNGPIHYSSNINGLIIELYPATKNNTVDISTRLGFCIDDLDDLCTTLYNNQINFQHLDCDTIITQDPDGRKIHITTNQ